MSAPKSLVEVAHSLGLSADSVQSALSVEILEFVSTVDAQEANLRRSVAHDPSYSSHTATQPYGTTLSTAFLCTLHQESCLLLSPYLKHHF